MRFRRKLYVLYGVFLVGLVVIWGRVAELQTFEGGRWALAAKRIRQRTRDVQAPRGVIVDRTGAVLAEDARRFQLALNAWEWKRRGRVRCSHCGLVRFYETGPDRKPPRRCACARYRGTVGARPPGADTTLEPLPPSRLDPLERALGVPRGTLADLAARRLTRIEGYVEALVVELREAGVSEFQIGDRRSQKEDELLRRPFVLYTGVSPEVVRLVQLDEEGTYRGFRIQTALRRRYPQGDFAPQLLGFLSKVRDEAEFKSLFARKEGQVTRDSGIGRSGLERAYNWQLAGAVGERVEERDRDGRFTRVVSETPPRMGSRLRLSIDLAASRMAEERLARHGNAKGYAPRARPSGGFVMLDAVNGRALIWAEMPRFDLNKDLAKVFDARWTAADADRSERRWVPRGPLPPGIDRGSWEREQTQPAPLARSRVAGLAVEPGSTFKPLIALAALHAGRPLPFATHFCGHGSDKPHCHGCGTVGLVEAISRSCNRFFAALLRSSKPAFQVYSRTVPVFLEALGIGQRPGSEIPEWAAGLWLRDWTDFSVREVIADAVGQIRRAHPERRLEAVFAPARIWATPVGGNRALLTKVFKDLLLQIWRESGTTRIGVGMTRLHDGGSEVDMRFDLRPIDVPGWSHLPLTHRVAAFDALPAALKRAGRRVPAMGGRLRFEGSFARGGKVWFSARFDTRVGRRSRVEPRRIRLDDAANVAIGQGPVLVTPLQMARAMAVIANGGQLVEPQVGWMLDDRVLPTPDPVDLALEPSFLAQVREGMRGCVTTGTARRAGFGAVPATVYGKTGTAQVGAAWRPFSLPGESDTEVWHHWFVGFAERPGEHPVAFACVLHSRTEQAAGLTSAKAVAEILRAWYTRFADAPGVEPAGGR